MIKNITILGDGGWGTALGLLLCRAGRRVCIWGPFPDYIARLRRERVNSLYLPDIPLPPELAWTADRGEALSGADLAILAVPSKYFRETLQGFAGRLPAGCPVISVSKGLDGATHGRLTETAADLLRPPAVAVLSGPSHAVEVARGIPTAVVLACADPALGHRLQAVLMSPVFRVYTSDDVIGVELGGALKNVIALAVGASDGLGFGDNTRAALITRGLAEIARLGCALGARPETFAGLSGLGDLVVTCTSRWSRNRAVGERLGRGEKIEAILASMRQVAEGVTTCDRALLLAHRHQVRTPITAEVHALLHGEKKPPQAVQALLGRSARPEKD